MEQPKEGSKEGSSECCSSHCGGCCWGKAAVVLFLMLISAMAGFLIARCHDRMCMNGTGSHSGMMCPVTSAPAAPSK